jgi:hypothetical protein
VGTSPSWPGCSSPCRTAADPGGILASPLDDDPPADVAPAPRARHPAVAWQVARVDARPCAR